jgi:SAM-dependent methyltransferase/uncharacterized protein YbaR (Trm112 family)
VNVELKVPDFVRAALRCPACGSPLSDVDEQLRCDGDACGTRFPVVDGVPVLIHEPRSAFDVEAFRSGRKTTFMRQPRVERFFSRVIPEMDINYKAKRNYRQLATLLLEQTATPQVLVVGCGEEGGRGMSDLASMPSIRCVNTDVSIWPGVCLICDSHDLPFAEESFDGAVLQAVLEHVADPDRCAQQVRRVLKADGLVYAETPFMQQTHGGPYDFTRFTHLGHRRLFRGFEEIGSGATAGAATALAWAYQYFMLSFVRSRRARNVVKAVARLSSFWLKYVDRLVIDRPGTLDAASGFYFLGRKSERLLSDRELVGLYRGAGSTLPAGT